MRHLPLPSLFCLATFLTSASAQQAAPVQQPSTEQKERLAERDRGWQRLQKLRSEGQTAEAIDVAKELLATERERSPGASMEAVNLLNVLSELHVRRDEFDKAAGYQREILAITTELYGPDHWRVTDAGLQIKHVQKLADMTAAERMRIRTAVARHQEGTAHYQRGDFKAAILSEQQSWEIHRNVLGAEDLQTIEAQENLAFLHTESKQFQDAEELYRRALGLREAVQGRVHPRYAQNLHNLALLYQSLGDFETAEPLYREALEIRKEVLGEKHAHYADSLNNLANVYQSIGNYAKAAQFHRQALEIRKAVLGEEHLNYADSLHALAVALQALGDNGAAEPLYRQALAVRKEVQGDGHPDYAHSLYNLAQLYQSMGRYTKAEPLYQQTLSVLKKASSAEIVGEFLLRQCGQVVVEGDFDRVGGAKAVRFSHGQFCLVVESFDDSRGNLSASAKPVQQQRLMLA